MGILDCITHTSARKGIRAVIVGVEGVGKTTLACNAPRVLLMPLESGYSGVSVNKLPALEHFDFAITVLDEIIEKCAQGTFPYMSIVVDSATALERLIHQATMMTDPAYGAGNKKAMTMESALGGYGKAYTYANELFGNFLGKCDILAEQYGINIILTCHTFAAKIVDPTSGEYDCWDILLHSPKNQKTYGKREMLTQWADLIGFLHEPIFVTEGKTMNRGMSANQGHMLAVSRTPSYVAKNRFNMNATISIPKINGWNHLAAAIYQNSGVDVYNRDVAL
jgi:hypothetical protein